MESKGFASSKEYWIKFGWGIVVGAITAVAVLFFNYLMNLGLKFLWPEQIPAEPFSGSWQIIVILTVAGFIVGLIYHFTKAKEVGVFDLLTEEKVDVSPVPSGLLVSLVSLIGGFSVGPEVPSAMIGGWLATKASEYRKLSDEVRQSNVISSITAAYGGLFPSPLGAISSGFIGGPIFPLFFVGGTLGTVVTLLFPGIPIALSVGCLMVAVTAGILPIPLSLGVYTVLIVGVPLTESIPILIAAMTSFLVVKGFGLIPPAQKPKTHQPDNTQTGKQGAN